MIQLIARVIGQLGFNNRCGNVFIRQIHQFLSQVYSGLRANLLVFLIMAPSDRFNTLKHFGAPCQRFLILSEKKLFHPFQHGCVTLILLIPQKTGDTGDGGYAGADLGGNLAVG